jgi:hypothetical protein
MTLTILRATPNNMTSSLTQSVTKSCYRIR